MRITRERFPKTSAMIGRSLDIIQLQHEALEFYKSLPYDDIGCSCCAGDGQDVIIADDGETARTAIAKVEKLIEGEK